MNDISGNFVSEIVGQAKKPRTLSSRVYHTIRSDIICGKIAPGTRLVRRTIGKRLGVSPLPVIEALLRLEQDGLVVSEPMNGASVCKLTEEGVYGDIILREALESQAARLCAEKATPQQIATLYYLAGRLDEMMCGRIDYSPEEMERHKDFHMHVAHYSGFRQLKEETERIWLRRLLLFTWVSAAMNPVPANWHHDLVAAIATGDPAIADAKAREHARYGWDHFPQAIKKCNDVLSTNSPP